MLNLKKNCGQTVDILLVPIGHRKHVLGFAHDNSGGHFDFRHTRDRLCPSSIGKCILRFVSDALARHAVLRRIRVDRGSVVGLMDIFCNK